jgi:hypothetical protein
MIQVLSIYFLLILMTSILGVAVLKLLKLENHKETTFILITPFIGIAAIVSVSQTLGLVLPGKFVSILIGIILFISVIFIRKDYKKFILKVWEHKCAVLGFFIATLLSLLSLLYIGYPTSISALFNNDLIVYLTGAGLLNKYSYLSHQIISNGFPAIKLIYQVIKVDHNRVGLEYFMLNIMNITGLEPYQVFGIISALFFSLFSMALYFIARGTFKFKKISSYIVLAFSCGSPLVITIMFSQFIPQLAGACFLMISIALIYRAISKKELEFLVLTSLIISAMLSFYCEMAVYFILIAGGIFILFLIRKRIKLKDFFTISMRIGIFTILFNVAAFVIAFNLFFLIFRAASNDSGVGNVTYFVPILNYIGHMMGIFPSLITSFTSNQIISFTHINLTGVFSFLISHLHIFITGIYCIIIFMLLAGTYGFLKGKAKFKNIIFYMVCIGIIFYIYFKYIRPFAYGVYKNSFNSEWIFILFISYGLGNLIQRIKNIEAKRIITVLVLVFVILTNLLSNLIIQKTVIFNPASIIIDDNFTELRQVNNIVPRNEPILLQTDHYGETHLVAYFLSEHNVSLTSSSYFGNFIDKPSNGFSKYVLSSSYNNFFSSNEENIIWQNERFALYKGRDFFIKNITGFYDTEKIGEQFFKWMAGEANFSVDSRYEGAVTLNFDIINVVSSSKTNFKTINVYFNDNLAGSFIAEKGKLAQISVPTLLFRYGDKNFIKIKILEGGNFVLPDPRELSIAITNFRLEKIN